MGSFTLPIFQNKLCHGLIKVAPCETRKKILGTHSRTHPPTNEYEAQYPTISKVHNMFSFLLLVLLIFSSFLAPPSDGAEGNLPSPTTIHISFLFGSSSFFFFNEAGMGDLLVVAKVDFCQHTWKSTMGVCFFSPSLPLFFYSCPTGGMGRCNIERENGTPFWA